MEGISDFDFFIPPSDKKKLIVILKKMKFIEFLSHIGQGMKVFQIG